MEGTDARMGAIFFENVLYGDLKHMNFILEDISRQNCPVLGQFCQQISQECCHRIHCQPSASGIDVSSKADIEVLPEHKAIMWENSLGILPQN